MHTTVSNSIQSLLTSLPLLKIRKPNAVKISKLSYFTIRIAMSGTPNSNTILDIWHPALLIDDGKRLGTRFYTFRHQFGRSSMALLMNG